MATKTLNTTICDNLKCSKGKKQEDTTDALCSGLTIRVTDKGKKTWCFIFTPPGKGWQERARLTLGTYPALGVADARTAAEAARGLVQKGTDPRTVDAPLPKMTIRELCARRLEEEVRAKGKSEFRSADQIERRYNKDIIPVIGDVLVEDFKVTHYNKVIYRINEREAFVSANRVHCDLKRLMKFAVRCGEIAFSPISEFDPPHKEHERERWLKVPEIVHFWHQCPKALIRSPKVQLILKLLLVTGKRSDQVCGARRDEFDFGKKLWTIPKARVKGMEDDAKDELVPLSDLAIMLLQEAGRKSNSDFLFPDDDADGSYQPGVVSKAVNLALEPWEGMPKGRFEMEKWTPHDLRRTVGTQLLNRENGLGITKEQKYLVLNHVAELNKNVSDRVYDHNDYLPEKREALDKWGTFLAKLVGVEIEQKEAA